MERLDVIISKRGILKSREKAKEMILNGKVLVEGNVILKPSTAFNEDVKIEVKSGVEDYISRGGRKLAKALRVFNIDVSGLTALDVGASTGGFTDCLLKNGCRKVFAVDVGRGQLSDELSNDLRVKNLEGVNIRYIDCRLLDEPINFFTVDVSFISLSLVLEKIHDVIQNNACGVCLIKPQFEAGKSNVGKNGVVKDSKVHCDVINRICNFCLDVGFSVAALDFSPVKGPEGNIEYLIYIQKCSNVRVSDSIDIKKIVRLSHEQLNYGAR